MAYSNRKVLNIAQNDHYWDYAVDLCELQREPRPDFSRRKTIRSFLFDALWIGVAIFAVYFVSRI